MIVTTQRRAGKLSERREQMTLELTLLTEQKTAKIIALIEEMRRDSPQLHNRIDQEARDMSAPADPNFGAGRDRGNRQRDRQTAAAAGRKGFRQ